MLRTKPICKSLVYDVVIIGGGPVGSAIAYHCAQKQLGRIAVIERDKTYQSCSAMLSAGGIRQQFSVPENIKMSMYGAIFLKNMEALAVDGEIPDINFRENGYLYLAGYKGKHILERNNKTQKACGADWIHLLTSKQLGDQFPWLNTEGIEIGSFSSKNEGYFDPWVFVSALKKKSISMGVDYIDGTVVGARMVSNSPSSVFISTLHVEPNKNKMAEQGREGGGECSIFATSPPSFEVSSGTFVNAAGAWAGKLVQLLKSETQRPAALASLPVEARKRCIFNIHCPRKQRGQEEVEKKHQKQPMSSHTTSTVGEGSVWGEDKSGKPAPPSNTPLVIGPKGVYFRPEGSGGKYITGLSPLESEDPDCDDSALETVDHAMFQDSIWPELAEMVPAFEELKVTSSWAGFYDYNTLDQNGIIGHHPEIKNLILCNGFSGHGLQQSPAAGRAVSEIIESNGKFSTLDLSRLSFERVLENKGIHEDGIV